MSAEVGSFLETASIALKAIAQARDLYASRLAPDFNLFEEYISPREVDLSRILADLLNPKGPHAQKSRFLEAFLDEVRIWEKLGIPANGIKTETVSVRTEVKTTNIEHDLRRMDIVIRWGSNALAIENKPWADDDKDQIKDYTDHLRAQSCEHWCLLYLSGNGEGPSECSIDAETCEKLHRERRLIVRGYKDLLPWLNRCMAVCEAERVRWFLLEFKTYIQAEFLGVGGDMQEEEEIVGLTLKSTDNLIAALKVSAQVDNVKAKLLGMYRQQLERLFEEEKWTLRNWTLDKGGQYKGFNIYFLDQQRYFLRFEFNSSHMSILYTGISKDEELVTENDDENDGKIKKLLDKKLVLEVPGRSGKSNNYWPWYIEMSAFDPALVDWQSNVEPWLHILEGKLAEETLSIAQKFHDVFSENNSLNLLTGNFSPSGR